MFIIIRKNNIYFKTFQSGFMPGDSTVNQVTGLYNEICEALDDRLEFKAVVFLHK